MKNQNYQGKMWRFSRWFICLLTLTALWGSSSDAQVVTLVDPTTDGGFEVGSGSFTDNGWTVAAGVATNQWFTQDNSNNNPASPFAGTKCAYISSNGFGTTYDYNLTSPSTVYFYRDIVFPAGKPRITISMKYKVVGEAFFDRGFVCYTSTANTPVTNDVFSSAFPAYATSISNNANSWAPNFGVWTNMTVLLPSTFAGTTQRIIVGWQNNNGGGGQPPIAFDNISITAGPNITATADVNGGLWSDAATWVGGAFPGPGDNVLIPDGTTITLDGSGSSAVAAQTCNNLTIGGGTSGTLNFIGTATFNSLSVNGTLTVNNGGKLNGFSQNATPVPNGSSNGAQINVAGNININSGGSICLAHSGAFLNMNGTSAQSINGPGTFFGGLVRNLRITNPTSVSLNIPITVNNTQNGGGVEHYAGNLITNGNLTIDETACYVNNPAISQSVYTVVVSNMGAFYGSAPTLTCGIPYNNGRTVAAGNVIISGGNMYVVTVAGQLGAAPSGTTSPQTSGTATLYYSGTAATAVPNYDPVTQKVRTVTITNGGTGYHANVTFSFNIPWSANMPVTAGDTISQANNMYIALGSGTLGTTAPTHTNGNNSNGSVTLSWIGNAATATGVVLQSIQGNQFGAFYDRNGGTTITGTININNTQNVNGVTITNTAQTNLNYTSAPTVGFGLPVRTFLTATTGSGYTGATVSFAYPSGTIATAPTCVATVVNGIVTSISISNGGVFVGGTGIVNVTINPTVGGSGATVADLSIPVATATITDGMISGFNVTAFGADYVTQPTVTLGTVVGAIPPLAANVTCRAGLYNVRYQTSTAVWPNVPGLTEGAEIPANRKLNALTINNANYGVILNNNLELTAASTALSVTSGVISFSGANNTITCSNPAYGGVSQSSLTNVLSWVEGKFTLTTPGGNATRIFPMARHGFQLITGTGSGAAGASGGCDMTSFTGEADVAPTGSFTTGTYNFAMNRTYKLTYNNGSQLGSGATIPSVSLFGNTDDGFASDLPSLFVAQAPAVTGQWTVRSVSSGTGPVNTSFARQTSATSPGPIALTNPMYFAWATNFTPPAPLNYNITRTTGNTYNSIVVGSSPIPGTWTGSAGLATEIAFSAALPLTGTTFQFQGTSVTGIKIGLDGYLTFNTAYTSNLSTPNLGGSATGITNITKTLAPFWGNLGCTPNDQTTASRDNSIRYRIDGTLGSGNAIINIEWIHMGGSVNPVANTGSDLNFQVQLFENGNIIKFNYGLMKGFDGTNKTPWNYACGMNGSYVSSFPAPGEALALQEHDENTTNFTNNALTSAGRGANDLHTVPECYSSYIFNPNIAPVPFVPGSGVPANDDPAGAILLTELTAPPSDYCGAVYSSFGASATAPANACAGTSANTDVWFKFIATDPATAIKVVSSGGYDAVVQVFDASFNSLAACTNVSVEGLFEVANVSGLTLGNTYYVRVFHSLVGTQATATAVVNAGSITAINITNPGSGYFIPAASSNATARVRITGNGTGAVLTAIPTGAFASPSGITSLQINSTGIGYTAAPTITIDPPSAGLTGDFYIAVYSNSPPPVNDGICSATALTVNSGSCNPIAGTTLGATASGGIPVCTGNADDDVFYSFVATSNIITVKVAPSASFDPVVQILSSNNNLCSGTLSSFICQNNFASGVTEAIVMPTGQLTAGNTYFVRVYNNGSGAGSGTFTICVFESGPPCPVITSPIGTLSNVVGSTIKWNSVAGSTGYDVYFSTVQADVISGAPAALVSSNQPGLTYSTGALTNGVTYYYRVDGRNSVGASDGCLVRSLTGTNDIIIGSDQVNTCSGNFYDAGGPSGNYYSNENSTTTICPNTVGTSSKVTFTSFQLGLPAGDTFTVYDGPTIASPLLATVNSGGIVPVPGPFTSTDASGCLTFKFVSAANNSGTGWAATVNCAIACSPSPVSPANGGSLCELPANTLSWPSNPGATGYDVYFDNTPNPTTLVVNNQNVLSYNTGALAAGVYYWKVVNRNGAIVCASPTVWSFTVRELPTPDATNSSPTCAGNNITLFGDNLTVGQSTGNTFSWTGPNSFSSSAQNPSISNASTANAGTYTLTVTNQYGCTAPSTTTDVTVNPNPVLSIATQTNVSCNGLSDGSVDLDATSGTAPFLFDLTGPSTPDGIFTGLPAGVYTATVNDDNGCAATSLTVTITEPDVLTVSAGSNTPICSGNSLNLTSSPVGGTTAYSYAWTGPNGPVPAVQNPTIASATTADAGQYDVLITDAHGCTSTASHTVQVNASPSAAIALSGSPNKCLGQSATVTLTFTGTGPWNYTITGNGGPYTGSTSSNPAIVNVTPIAGGVHTYTVTSIGNASCPTGGATSGSAIVNVSTAPPPSSGPVPAGAAEACAGSVMLITSNVISGQNIIYSWNTGSNSSTVLFSTNIGGPFTAGPFQTNTNQVYVQFGALAGGQSGYQVCLQGVNGCGSSINKCLWIRGVVSGPGAITPANGVVACENTTLPYSCGASAGATIYNWTLGGSATPITSGQGTQNVQVTFPSGFTSAQLCVTAALACGGSSTSPARCMSISKTPANANVPTGAATVCPGATGVSYSIPAVAGATGYNWTVPANATIATGTNSPSITVNFPTPYNGTSSVCVTTTSACGTSAVKCKNVASGIPNQPAGITGPLTNVCGSTVQYSVVNPIASSYTWTNPAGTTISGSATGSTILLNVSSTFTSGVLTVAANSTLCPPATSAPRTSSTIWGRPNNPGAITANPSVWCSGGFVNFFVTAASPLPSYNWTVSNGTIDAGQGTSMIDVTWGVTAAGTVSVNASNTCGQSAGTSSQSFSAGCREEGTSSATAFSVYPNPAHDKITVSIDVKEQTGFNLELRDMSGRVILSEDREGAAGINAYELDLKGFAKGIYMLEVQSANDTWKSKVIIE